MPWFPQREAEKVRGGSTSPEGRAVLHQAADESCVRDQELRWAKEGLCTIEDSQSVPGFGGQLGNVTFPGKIMADSEAQKLEFLHNERTSSRGLFKLMGLTICHDLSWESHISKLASKGSR